MDKARNIAQLLDVGERTRDVIIDENITFRELWLSTNTLTGLEKCGFKKPSPIQLKAIPLGKCGFDLIVEAKSGTGKTAVFGVIALESIMMNPQCQCIILAPTREIAAQVGEVISSIGVAFEGLKIEIVMGGTNIAEDIQRLSKGGFQVIVGSPGRMKHLIQEGIIPLESVRLLVLDEADKLMEDNFQKQVNYIFSKLPERKQLIMASATYTQEMRDFLGVYMRSPTHVCPYTSCILLGVKQFLSLVPNHLNAVRQNAIFFDELKKILTEVSFNQCLIFCNYQCKTRNTCAKLVESGWPAQFLCSSQNQKDRLNSLKMLQSFQCRILVATDLAARGIDAANVDLIINLECPYDLPTYLHRIGRCGRYGSRGTAVTILPMSEENKFKTMLQSLGGEYFDVKPFRTLNAGVEPANNIDSTSPTELKLDLNNKGFLLPLFLDKKRDKFSVEDFEALCASYDSLKKEKKISNADSLVDPLNEVSISNNLDESDASVLGDKPTFDVLEYLSLNIKELRTFDVMEYLSLCIKELPLTERSSDVDYLKNDHEHNRNKIVRNECADALNKVSIYNNMDESDASILSDKPTFDIVEYLSLHIKDWRTFDVLLYLSLYIQDLQERQLKNLPGQKITSNHCISSEVNYSKNDHEHDGINRNEIVANECAETKSIPHSEKCNVKKHRSKVKESKSVPWETEDEEVEDVEDEYLRWRHQLQLVSNYIQQSVYLETMYHS